MMNLIKRHKIISAISVAVIVFIFIGTRVGGNGKEETVSSLRGNLVKTVELAGKVVPKEDADLSFEVLGTTAHVYKKVGDTIVQGELIADLDQSGTFADVLKAQADLEAASIELSRLSGGSFSQTKITNSKTSVVQNIINAYTNADDAIYSKTDQFFKDPRTANPKIDFAFNDYVLRNSINAGRVEIGSYLASWKERVLTITAENYTSDDLDIAKTYLKAVGAFLSDVSRAVNSFEVNQSISQTMIDKYRTDVATARSNINNVSTTLITGEDSLSQTTSDVPLQATKVKAAEANLANVQAKLAKMTLRSPISGIISRQDLKVGESVSPNTVAVSVISTDYKIEAYVPEVSVAGVMPGARAKVTLDAYGKDVSFDATILMIDPRETIRDGVSTYKIELAFSLPDARIRSGMTANISIETARKDDVVFVPERVVVLKNGSKVVSVKDSDGVVSTKNVETGVTDSKGNIEIVSGLSEGDVVLLNPKP